ncbi:MAG: YIP1 family protein, partial [Clostridia bacterium]|nr:YIP1 family protein [Clostridia bacterium]
KGALEYAKLGEDRDTYSRAFEYVRKEVLKDNFIYITIGLVALIVVVAVLLHFKKKYNVVLIKNRKLKIALGTLLHPADTFYEIKRNKGGSVLIATGFLLVWYAFKIIGFSSGFLFNTTDIRNANAWYALAQTFGLVILFTLANWAVCTLMEGKGKLKDIYIVTCYSLIPMIIQAVAQNVLSEVLTLQEANVMSILTYVCIVFTAIILVMGLINLHEYTFGKFIFTTFVTLLAMVLIVFLIFMIAILLQQTKNFVETVYLEAFFR